MDKYNRIEINKNTYETINYNVIYNSKGATGQNWNKFIYSYMLDDLHNKCKNLGISETSCEEIFNIYDSVAKEGHFTVTDELIKTTVADTLLGDGFDKLTAYCHESLINGNDNFEVVGQDFTEAQLSAACQKYIEQRDNRDIQIEKDLSSSATWVLDGKFHVILSE